LKAIPQSEIEKANYQSLTPNYKLPQSFPYQEEFLATLKRIKHLRLP
jgi:hypothetical protein